MLRIRALVVTAFLILSLRVLAQYRPMVESIEPSHDSPAGGATITIRGKHLAPFIPAGGGLKPLCTPCPPAPPIVLIGGKGATVVSYKYDELIVIAPPSAGGRYDVQVSNAYAPFGSDGHIDEHSVVLPRAFTYGGNELDVILVPVYAEEVSGAFGSIWSTEFLVRNDNASQVWFGQIPGAFPTFLPPKTTGRPRLTAQGGGAFVYHEHIANDSSRTPLAFNLRIRDLSRQADSWGTEVPLVRREDAFINRAMDLLNVPFEPESRLMLRVYDLDGPTGGQVPVYVYDNESHALLGSTVLHFPAGAYDFTPAFPGYVSLDVKSIVSDSKGAERIRLRVGEKVQEKRLWSLLSVTDLETQQVTLITPEK